MINLLPEIEILQEQLTEWRRHFHRNPEPSLHEYETAAYIQKLLTEWDIPFEKIEATGTLATITGTKINPDQTHRKILLRADIDALELPDQKNAEYSSTKPGLNHACGHDAHTAALLGATYYLANHREEFAGTVLIAFQQAEEIGGGARHFLSSGLLEDVGQVFGIHVDPEVPYGSVEAVAGAQNASCDIFTIEVFGKNAHVAQPHQGTDALIAGANIVTELQNIVARQTDPQEPVVVGIGVFESGTRYNIVADHALIEGTVRALSHESREQTLEKVKQIAKLTAEIHGANATFENWDAALPVINDEEAAQRAARVAGSLVGLDQVITAKKASMGADDFAAYLVDIQGVYVRVGVNSSSETSFGLHHNQFDLDERALPLMANFHVAYALDYLNEA